MGPVRQAGMLQGWSHRDPLEYNARLAACISGRVHSESHMALSPSVVHGVDVTIRHTHRTSAHANQIKLCITIYKRLGQLRSMLTSVSCSPDPSQSTGVRPEGVPDATKVGTVQSKTGVTLPTGT